MNPIEIKTARGGVLYDGQLLDGMEEAWFEADYWYREGLVEDVATGRGTTLIVKAAEGSWVLRHFQRGGLFAKPFKDRYLWSRANATRPFREWRLLRDLFESGLPVPRPVAARFERSGIWYRGDLITHYLPATQSFAELLDAGPPQEAVWESIGRVLRRFHDAGVCHADLNAHNILLNERGEVFVVDFDRGERKAQGSWQQSNLQRLERSVRKLATQRGGDFPEVGWRALQSAYAD